MHIYFHLTLQLRCHYHCHCHCHRTLNPFLIVHCWPIHAPSATRVSSTFKQKSNTFKFAYILGKAFVQLWEASPRWKTHISLIVVLFSRFKNPNLGFDNFDAFICIACMHAHTHNKYQVNGLTTIGEIKEKIKIY